MSIGHPLSPERSSARGSNFLRTPRRSSAGGPQLGLVARQLDDFHHQAEERDDERRDAEYQCYDCRGVYMYHLP